MNTFIKNGFALMIYSLFFLSALHANGEQLGIQHGAKIKVQSNINEISQHVQMRDPRH